MVPEFKLVNVDNTSVETQPTFSHLAAASRASTAFLTAPRTLSTSSHCKNFSSKKAWRAEVILAILARSVLSRCLCQDLLAYCKAWLRYFFFLSSISSTSELTTASGSLHIFLSSVLLINSRQDMRIFEC